MAIMRHAVQTNTTGAPLTKSSLKDGRDYKELSIERVFAAIDVGTEAGKTQHADGCLLGTIEGGIIYKMITQTIQKGDPFTGFSLNKVTTTGGIKIGPDKKSLYVREDTDGAVIAAGDALKVTVLIGPA